MAFVRFLLRPKEIIRNAESRFRVTIFGLYNSLATTVFGSMDIFNQAGRLWNSVSRTVQNPFFEVAVSSADGQPIQCINKVPIQPHCSVEAVQETDLIIIASAACIEEILRNNLPGRV